MFAYQADAPLLSVPPPPMKRQNQPMMLLLKLLDHPETAVCDLIQKQDLGNGPKERGPEALKLQNLSSIASLDPQIRKSRLSLCAAVAGAAAAHPSPKPTHDFSPVKKAVHPETAWPF